MRPKRRLVAALLATFALVIGVASAMALTGGTTATYTYTVPGTTLAIPAQTYTQTVAIPTVTQTVTQTVTVGTTTSSAPTYASETAYTQTPPAFTVQRDVPVASQAQLASALSSLKCGDDVHATSSFTVVHQFHIGAAPSCTAVIDLHGVSFTGGSAAPDYAAAWIDGAANLRIYGGDITNAYSSGILVNSATNVLWWGFAIHDTGGGGLAMLPNGGDVNGNDFAGTITHWSLNLSIDNHPEKCTGMHGAILADVDGAYTFNNNRLALDEWNGPCGAGVEIGDADGSSISGNTLYLRVKHLTYNAQSQVAGNALQLWGKSTIGLDVPYLEASDLTGKAVEECCGYYGSVPVGTTVDYGRASNTEQNPRLAGQPTWDTDFGIVYGDIG